MEPHGGGWRIQRRTASWMAELRKRVFRLLVGSACMSISMSIVHAGAGADDTHLYVFETSVNGSGSLVITLPQLFQHERSTAG